MRRLLIALLVLAVLLLAADEGARRYEESRLARSIQTSLKLRAPPQVTLHGFPFLPALVQGRISSASISSSQVTAESIRFSDVRVQLQDVRFSVTRLLRGTLRTIHATRGSGTASITSASLGSYLHGHGAPLNVAIRRGRVVAKAGPLSAALPVRLSISDNHLQLAAGPLPSFSIPLPDILHGLVYGSVVAADSKLRLSFRLHHPSLDLE
ncbi:MAG: DUF2993 domain-containing protein, partial [Actinomycetota bacterium]|nr:DUF2993 domain-containing protein [Actinomycetota bacterium]